MTHNNFIKLYHHYTSKPTMRSMHILHNSKENHALQKKGYTTFQTQFAITDWVCFIYNEKFEFEIVDNYIKAGGTPFRVWKHSKMFVLKVGRRSDSIKP